MKYLRNPDLFHGHGRRKNFFEGWYFKLVDASKKHAYAFIPGIIYGREPVHHHSFLQVVQAVKTKYDYLTYSTAAFTAAQDSFKIGLDQSRFSLEGIKMSIERPEIQIQGTLNFTHVLKWPDTWLNPGSMGFYNYIPQMQCYAQVCAMDMEIDGSLMIDGQEIDFSGGRGYVEKNWGKSFPYSWIWIQSNHFSGFQASISCSLAHIPLPVGSFRGFLVGFLLNEQFYTFTTMNRSRIKVLPRGQDVSIRLENQHHILTMDTETRSEDFILLKGPRDDQMIPLVEENLAGRVGVTLINKRTGEMIFQGVGDCAGIEYGGNQMMVLNQNSGEGLKNRNE